jgi:hypothetical protein
MCETTFEKEITSTGALTMLEKAVREVGAPSSPDYLRQVRRMAADGERVQSTLRKIKYCVWQHYSHVQLLR